MNKHFQVKKQKFTDYRIVEFRDTKLNEDEVLLRVDQFAYTSNNITYALVGDKVGYWQFYPPQGGETDGWGIIPVWGYAEVEQSNVDEIQVGERLFGYFPPAHFVKMKPIGIKSHRFFDGSLHRQKLPSVYNMYKRVNSEATYDTEFDKEKMLLFPLHLTSYCLWDFLQDKAWFEAKQIIVLSASSKTSTGLGYALQSDSNAPQTIGLTSKRNLDLLKSFDIYDRCFSYAQLAVIDTSQPTVIIDMSGNAQVLADLHQLLGDNMKYTLNVGMTHWDHTQQQEGIITDRSSFFFAPNHLRKRLEEWGPAEFDRKSNSFMVQAAQKTKHWLTFTQVDGLNGLAAIHKKVCDGGIPPNEGLIIKM